MDFILNRPLQRFSDSQSYFDSSLFSSYVLNIKLNKNTTTKENEEEAEETDLNHNFYLNRNQIKLELIVYIFNTFVLFLLFISDFLFSL